MLVTVLIFAVVFLVCAGVAARALARMGRQLARTGVELERLGTRLDGRFLPQAEEVMNQVATTRREVEEVSGEARSVSLHFEAALAAVGDITVMTEEAVRPIAAAAAAAGMDRRRLRAVRAGSDAFFGRLTGRRGGRHGRRPLGPPSDRSA